MCMCVCARAREVAVFAYLNKRNRIAEKGQLADVVPMPSVPHLSELLVCAACLAAVPFIVQARIWACVV